MTESKYIWMDGEFVAWHDAKVHVLSHTLHYGNGAIEGTKAYKTVDGRCAIFKLNEHTKRLLNSSKMTLMDVPFSLEELNKGAENAPSSGMGPILDESLLPLSLQNTLHILNNAETLDSETLKLMVSRISNMKPLDPEFNKILNDNFLELF